MLYKRILFQRGKRCMQKVIITGSTGMVGEGVLHECLKHSDIESVLVINQKTMQRAE